MIQLEKVIERGERYISEGKLKWFKFADGTYLMAGRVKWTTATDDTRFTFNLSIPISVAYPAEVAVTVTNVYHSRRICIWSAGMTTVNQIRFDVEPVEPVGAASSGIDLGCSFILLGK